MQIVVLGMHRSGTSVATRLINLMGAYCGDESAMKGASAENAKGFWEREDVLQLNKDVMKALGADWHRVASFDPARLSDPALDPFRKRARNILVKLEAHRPWVVKEPRLCLLFPFWRELLELPLVVHVVRSPIQVAQSLKTRNGFALRYGLALWEVYALRALESATGLPQTSISYNQLLADPVRTVGKFFDRLVALGTRRLELPSEAEIRAAVSAELHRERGDGRLESECINQAQSRLLNAMRNGSAFEWAERPTLSAGAREAIEEFEAGIAREAAEREARAEIEDRLKAAGQRIEEIERERDAAKESLHEEQQERRAERKERDAVERDTRHAEEKAAELQQKLEERRMELHDVSLERNGLLRDLAAVEVERRAAVERLKKAERRHAEEMEAQVRALTEAGRRHEADIEEKARALAETKRRLDEFDFELRDARQEREVLEKDLAAVDLERRALTTKLEEEARRFESEIEKRDRRIRSEVERREEARRIAEAEAGKLKGEAHQLRREERRLRRALRVKDASIESLVARALAAREDEAQLGRWLEQLFTNVEEIVRSRRFRTGHLIVEVWLKRLLRKPTRGAPWAPDHARETIERYRKWREGRAKAEPPAPTKTPARPEESDRSDRSDESDKSDPSDPPATVAVAIHNACDDVRACIQSLLRHTAPEHPILLIDDASADTRIAPMLREFASAHPRITPIFNETNLGYTRTINLACRRARGDVVLLNSDTIVTRDWLKKLIEAARSRPDVATVTPLSNAAGAFSVPENNAVNALPPDVSVDAMGELLERHSTRLRPEAPTGNGFCLYVARRALDAVGPFDEANFPRGYGEENDFCVRASRKGFVHLIDDATFIYHKRSASFGEEKGALLAEGRAALARLHPDYKKRVDAWLASDPLAELRARLREDLSRESIEPSGNGAPREAPPALLMIVHNGKGGTAYTTEDLLARAAGRYRAYLLKTDLKRWSLNAWTAEGGRELQSFTFRDEWRLEADLDDPRREVLRRVCSERDVRLAHVRHLLAHAPETIDFLQSIGVPVVYSFHDFYSICPTINLLDDKGVYCAGHCTPGEGECAVPDRWLRRSPTLKHRYVHEWRERVGRSLARCEAWVTTSAASREALTEHFSFLNHERFRVIEHGRDLSGYGDCAAPPGEGPIRVVLMGGLNQAKGLGLIEPLLRLNRDRGDRFRFHLLGPLQGGARLDALGAVHAWEYHRDELPGLLAEIAPSLSLIPSQWPETYCHTLTESWASGIPVLASDIGTLRERVGACGGGWLVEPTSAERWMETMNRVVDAPEEWPARKREIEAIRFPSVAEMAERYFEIYDGLLATKRRGGFEALVEAD